MARPGRKPLPDNVHYLHGNPGKRARDSSRQPQYKEKTPPCPKFLGPVARKEWRFIAPKLMKARVLTEVDKAVLIAYCTSFEQLVEGYQRLREALEQNPDAHLIRTASGYVMKNPYYSVIGQAKKEMNSAMAELGITPSSRSRIIARGEAQGAGGSGGADVADADRIFD